MSEGFIVPKTTKIYHRHQKSSIPKIVSVRIEGRDVIATLECGHEATLFTIPKKRTHCYPCTYKNKVTETVTYHQYGKEIPLGTDKVQ